MNDKATPTEATPSAAVAEPLSQSGSPRPRPLTVAERWSVGLLSLLLGLVLLWALILPWHPFNWFTLLCTLTGIGHLVTAVTCLTTRLGARASLVAWRITSLSAAVLLLWVTWIVARSGTYLSALYGGLGQGLSAAMVAIWGIAVLLTLPLAVWGLVRTRASAPQLSSKHGLLALGAVLVGFASTFTGTAQARLAAGTPATAQQWQALVTEEVAPVLRQLPLPPKKKRSRTKKRHQGHPRLDAKLKTTCAKLSVDNPDPTVIVHYTARKNGRAATSCLTDPSLERLSVKVTQLLRKHSARSPVAVDFITHARSLDVGPTWLAALRLRPGLDGVCLAGKCLTAWQLLAQSAFITHAPLAFLADLKFGVSLSKLRRQLRSPDRPGDGSALIAISTHSMSVTVDGAGVRLRRLRPEHVALSKATVMKAESRLERHILQSQQKNGQFRYTLDPFTGKKETRNFNLPRQAGTLLAICELGRDTKSVREGIHRGLALLTKHHRKHEDTWALALKRKTRVVRLGDAALPLIAFLSCRSRVGDEFDPAIAGLTRFVLSMQNADGSFASNYDWKKRKKLGGPEALYAPGQALLALVLLDHLLFGQAEPNFSEAHPVQSEQLTNAIQRGMNHVANQHWDIPAYSFFFIEENWNCLTARAALERQRNSDYERFCLDYMKFKARLILDEESRVDPQYIGGFGFGNVIPPHNTGAAGVGEALAAAIAVKVARQDDTSDEQRLMRSLMGFLLRQQWTPENCFACVPEAIGAVSEHTHSPITRIDFAQHAWAALGHGQRALEL